MRLNDSIIPPAVTAEDVLRRYNAEDLADFCEPLEDVNQIGIFNNRAIHLASYRGIIADVVALVDAGADVNARGDMGSTPLHDAAAQGHIQVVAFLLARGASEDCIDDFGHAPIDVARLYNRVVIVRLLEWLAESGVHDRSEDKAA